MLGPEWAQATCLGTHCSDPAGRPKHLDRASPPCGGGGALAMVLTSSTERIVPAVPTLLSRLSPSLSSRPCGSEPCAGSKCQVVAGRLLGSSMCSGLGQGLRGEQLSEGRPGGCADSCCSCCSLGPEAKAPGHIAVNVARSTQHAAL